MKCFLQGYTKPNAFIAAQGRHCLCICKNDLKGQIFKTATNNAVKSY